MIVLSADDCGTSKLLWWSSSTTAESETQQNHCHMRLHVVLKVWPLAKQQLLPRVWTRSPLPRILRILLACVGEPVLALFVACACVGQDGLEFWQLTCQFAPDGRLTLCSSPAATPLVRRIYIQRTSTLIISFLTATPTASVAILSADLADKRIPANLQMEVTVTVDFVQRFVMSDSSLRCSGMARVNEGSHSFTCHPHVHPQVE